VLAQTLIELDPRFPTVDDATRDEMLVARGELEAEAE
jgi:hypothetical protein